MKKYKQILAGLLAMNLAVYVMPTGMIQISASVQNQNNEHTDTEAGNSVQPGTDVVEAEITQVSAQTDDASAVSETADSVQDNIVDNIADTTDTNTSEDVISDDGVDVTEDVNSDIDTDIFEDINTELPEDNTTTDNEKTSEFSDSAEFTSPDDSEELFSDGEQSEAVVTAEDNTAEQIAGDKPVLSNFIHYKDGNIDIESVEELILLSNCDPKEIQDLTINLKLSGDPKITSNVKIAATADISSFYNDTATVSVEEDQQSEIENAENTQSDSQDNQSEEINQDSAEDIADATKDLEETQESNISQETTQSVEESAQETTADVSEETSDDNIISQTKVVAGQEYTFQGIGTADVPFQGKITGLAVPLSIDRAFFGGLSSSAKFTLTNNADLSLYWCGDGTKPMIADVYQFDSESENGHSVPVTVKKGTGITSMGSLFGTVQEAKDIANQTLILTKAPEYDGTEANISSADNAGLICNTLKSGNICLDGYILPVSKYTVESKGDYTYTTNTILSGNAGGLIGLMEKNTTLDIKSSVTIPDESTITASNGNAGGLVGLMQPGAKIKTEDNAAVTLNKMTIQGKVSAGGVVGTAEDVTFADEDITSDITVKSATITESEENPAENIGGFIGKYTLKASNLGEITEVKLPEHVKIESPTLTLSNANGLVGGYFGYLALDGKLTYIVGSESDTKTKIDPTYKDCQARSIGAIAGKVISTDITSTLLIKNMQIDATMNTNNGINYHGGLIGEVGAINDSTKAVYLEVSDSAIKVTNSQVTNDGNNGFGGIAGTLAYGSILKIKNTVTIEASGINKGGGVVGYAEKSVIDLSGTTDLSQSTYNKGTGKKAETGWLVGKQDCALIYAEGDGNGNGWSYIRGKENTDGKQAMNDIGNYGQIIRLHPETGDSASKLSAKLIYIDENHKVSYTPKTAVALSGDNISIGSEDAFALLSIAWNSRGYFGGVDGIEKGSTPRAKNITLKSDIDLSGSGISGLSRDTYSDEDTYSGIFDGGANTVILSIGETFGYKQNEQDILATEADFGYGEVISAGAKYHGRQGIFAKVVGATVKNVKIKGKINISNTEQDMLVGGIAGELAGIINKNNVLTEFSGVTAAEEIIVDCSNKTGGVMAGGLLGGCYDYSPALQLGTLGEDSTLNIVETKINLKNCTSETDETRINAGGIIGEVGESPFTLTANCLTVEGSITTSAKKWAYIGGLIGVIKGNEPSTNHQIQIKGVKFDSFEIDASEATEVCGGLFGSIWTNVGLYFMGKDDTDDGTATKLNVANAKINAPNAKNVGGLVYRSSGKWEIRDYGISLQKFMINAGKNVGLLVCRGEKISNEYMAGKTREISALHLSTTKYWGTSYKISDNVSISTTDSTGVFDEFVAYTTPTAQEIVNNNENGVISIATQENADGTRVGVDVSGCTTYQNRTSYGKDHPTNACSRYYYDLDRCLVDLATGEVKNSNNNKKLDTPQELLLWSVYQYACENIKDFFTYIDINNTRYYINDIKAPQTDSPWIIGETAEKEPLNMEKYSYYPVKCEANSVSIKNTEIKFSNERIENTENNVNNKSTQGTSEDHTQHYTMHCGLFLDYIGKGTLNVDTVTFSGDIGKVNNATSGALVADRVMGYKVSDDLRDVAVKIKDTVLSGLKVNGCGNDYAPLLINRIGIGRSTNNTTTTYGHTSLNINGLTVKDYKLGTAVASSLIGYAGSSTETSITMTFQKIVLPDKRADGTNGIFSHATLLESYAYSRDDNASSATYNFESSEDWKETEHVHNVTYGKEITGSIEFTDEQKWYYDEATHGIKDEGLVYDDVTNQKNFDASGYLPYVCIGYNRDNCTHEIKVNQRVSDIIHGCGTYGHPYRITKEQEMNILSEYMATGNPRKDWRVTVSKSQSQDDVHKAVSDENYISDKDVTYQYDINGDGLWTQVVKQTTDGVDTWVPVESDSGEDITLKKDFMLNYLLNAYYDIQGTAVSGSDGNQLVLNDFKGFGTAIHPFRGVITSKNNTTVVLKGEETGNGLIPYSYGSVVKGLKISYTGDGKTLSYGTSTYYPTACFGGVIGCILGGDNIIDDVTVDMKEEWLTLSENNKNLLQVGGYVGSVSGGGVIFRNMEEKNKLKTNSIVSQGSDKSLIDASNTSQLYVNPYVGRVLDGFAFYEADSKDKKLENTNKNYRINTLVTSDTDCVTAEGDTVTVNDAQGLLILSAVVNSGAASNGTSKAYSQRGSGNADGTAVQYITSDGQTTYSFGGSYGKVRNSSSEYKGIGEKTLSNGEDTELPGTGNLPYLINTYCTKKDAVFSAAMNSKLEIKLTDTENVNFDMSGYGNGYQGIGARYVSNAAQGNDNTNNPQGIIPELTSFDGNNKTLKMAIEVKEYKDDDYHAASVGGLFNILRVDDSGAVSNLIVDKIPNGTNSSVSLTYCDANGATTNVNASKQEWFSCEDVGVGGLIGSLVGYTAEDANHDITMSGIQLNNLTVTSPASAGGIVGNTGKLAANTADKNANKKDFKTTTNDIVALLQPQDSQITYGTAFNDCRYKDITITGKYAAGGFCGYIGNTNRDPMSSVNGKFAGNSLRLNMGESSTISATDNSSWAGGLFGYVKTRMFINMDEYGTKQEDCQAVLQDVSVSAGTAVGGCIGYIDEKCYGIYNVSLVGTNDINSQEPGSSIMKISLNGTTTGTFYAGGIVGYAKGAGQNWTYAGGISKSSVTNVQINESTKATDHDYSGAGEIQTNYIAGGIVGQVAGGKTRMEECTVTGDKVYGSVSGGIVGRTDSEMQFVKCAIKGASKTSKMDLKGFSTAGGILGFWTRGTGGNPVTIQNCDVQYINIEGKDWGVGTLVGDAQGPDGNTNVGILYLFDCSARDSNVSAVGTGGGRWPCVGGIIGNLRNTVKASNLLFSDVVLSSTSNKGLLFGGIIGGNVNIAGISIQNIPKANADWPLAGSGDVTAANNYIAFADYSGTAVSDSSNGKATDLLDDESVVNPYVVTSPKNSKLELYESEDATAKYIYGDGATWTSSDNNNSSFTVKAQEIWSHKDNVTDGHYAYKNITSLVSTFDASSVLSTYNANQTTQAKTNFPVVQIGANNADAVKNYLDIVTNGGFSAANSANNAKDVHVTAKTAVYEYKNGKFVKAEGEKAFKVNTDNKNQITFSTTTEYDNGNDRFTLLTVTFTEEGHNYNVFVPVLVRRMLEMDFTATLTYGTDFRKEDYNERTSHVLESFGSSITGYLTYAYNSAEGAYTDYGWESYINAGGNVMDMKKSIKFQMENVDKLPAGMQLTLVDASNGKAYYYTATGKENLENGGFNIPLGSFKDSSGKAYEEPSISELVGASASTTENNKLFIKVDETGKPVGSNSAADKKYPEPTVRIKNATTGKYEYYRRADSSLDETGEYTITVDESALKTGPSGKESSTVTENYYLVITVPEKSNSPLLNGSIQTTVESKIPHQIHYRKIKATTDTGKTDNHVNTPSTYVLSSGYTQTLEESGNRDINQKLSMSDSKLSVDVTNAITFPSEQIYNSNDNLYVRIVGGLQKTTESGTASGPVTSAAQFPSGTTGTAEFYVYTENNGQKTYYTYQNNVWTPVEDNKEQSAVSYTWTSTGNNMELPLSADGKNENVISLQSLRDSITGNNNATSTFYVQVKMDATIPGAGLDVIPETELQSDGVTPKDYVKLTYYSQLSTENQSLTYSNNRANVSQTTTAYYREEPAGIKLTYEADQIDQLGINLLDLQSAYLDAERQNTYIDTTATYDLSAMRNLKDTLKKSSGIKFTLSLMKKNTEESLEEYSSQITEAKNYLEVKLKSENSGTVDYDAGTWFWTVPKESYYDSTDNQIITSSVFDGSKLLQAIQLKVNVRNVETAGHLYSNYKVVLTADILGTDNNSISNTHKDDNIIYTLAKINTEFVE